MLMQRSLHFLEMLFRIEWQALVGSAFSSVKFGLGSSGSSLLFRANTLRSAVTRCKVGC